MQKKISDQTLYEQIHNFKESHWDPEQKNIIRMIRTSLLLTESFDFPKRNVNNNHLIQRLKFRAPLAPMVPDPVPSRPMQQSIHLINVFPKMLNEKQPCFFNRGLVTLCVNFSNVQIGA